MKRDRISQQRFTILFTLFVFLVWPSLACATGVHALFNPDTPAGGPFPSDRFTVADRSHNTGLRVNLPKPDCKERPSDCEDLDLINTLDGFNVQPRLSIPFDGPIDVKTVTNETVFLISLGSTLGHGERGGRVVGINQVVWDTFTNTLHMKSDEVLDQHTRYALIVTRAVQDESGAPVQASAAFRRFRQTVRGHYKHALLEAVHAARRVGVQESDIVAASVFTTMSATAILEKIRDQIKAATPEPADFHLGPDGARTVFALDTLTDLTWNRQTGDNPPRFTTVPMTAVLDRLRIIPGVVGQIAWGRFASPEYRTPERIIPPVGTRTGRLEVQDVNELVFLLILPSGPKPVSGWPVAIFGHGGGTGSNLAGNVMAASLAAQGIATIAITRVGAGFGPLSTLTVRPTSGDPVTFLSGGRAMTEWFSMPSDPVAYAPHLRKRPLPGVPAKPVIIGFSRGDRSVTNPVTTVVLRAGDLADRAMFYRHDRAVAEDPTLPRDPHDFLPYGFLVITPLPPAMRDIGLSVQAQSAVFFASDGVETLHPEPRRFFEVPVVLPLPDDFGFIP
jgi:hypothetical protein